MALFDDTYTGDRYTYGLTYRPVGGSNIPEGWIIWSDRPSTVFAHGTIDYPAELPASKVEHFQLTLVAR